MLSPVDGGAADRGPLQHGHPRSDPQAARDSARDGRGQADRRRYLFAPTKRPIRGGQTVGGGEDRVRPDRLEEATECSSRRGLKRRTSTIASSPPSVGDEAQADDGVFALIPEARLCEMPEVLSAQDERRRSPRTDACRNCRRAWDHRSNCLEALQTLASGSLDLPRLRHRDHRWFQGLLKALASISSLRFEEAMEYVTHTVNDC